MADLQNFAITPGVAVLVNAQDYLIEATVADSSTGAVVADYRGSNALHFPAVLGTLTQEQRTQVLQSVAADLVLMKAGLE